MNFGKEESKEESILNPLEYLDDLSLINFCEQMDIGTLLNLSEKYSRVYQICQNVIENKKKEYQESFEIPGRYIPTQRNPFPLRHIAHLSLNNNLVGFFNEAYRKGLLKGPDGTRIRIDNVLSGFSTIGELLDLFIIYIWNTGIQNTINNSLINVTSDPLFMKWFGTTLDLLENKPSRSRVDRNNFKFIKLNEIILSNSTKLPESQISETQKDQLITEENLVYGILNMWKERKGLKLTLQVY